MEFKNLALVVTDEQHRFGVEQRAALVGKGTRPHLLVMSATPIPRTLALIIYGDLDVSIIDELPPGRQKVGTFAVDESYRARLNGFIEKLAHEGRQIFVVCPRIEENEEGADGIKSAEEHAEALRAAQKKARGKRRTALEKAMESDLAQLDSGVMPEAMDKYYGLRYKTPATLLGHLSSPIFILDEVGGIRDAQKATEFRRCEELTGLLEEGVICPGLDVLYQTMDDLAIAAQNQSTLLCENFLRGMNEFKLKDLINTEAFAAPNWGGDLASLREDLDPLVQQGYAVALFAGTPKGAAALTRDLADKGYAVSMSRDVRPAKGLVQVLPGHLTAGCTFPFARVAVISSRRHGLDDEAAENKKRKKNKNALSGLSDIKPGDYVVHQSHGIGMYAGIQRLEVQGAIKDYLKIQYSGSDVLYVPVTQLDLLSRYTAPGDEEKVKLAKLGGTEWQRTRAKVKKATEEMAQELIELYARRRQATGYAFPADGDWQSDFESRFEYDETDDQLTATAEIKKDMEKGWPMDRLLCGDVGVGKTEVAFRAAFKCVMGGKQCAILAPTTLLAWQHYNSIISRMEAFPVKVGLLSRFRTAKQQKETLRGLQAGSVDIVIGTHRLLSKDVRFHDLGLVIIDEEQRFGVKHKEKLKENFIGVDMLTLSATPIPRTLNMAMSGIRDLSTIEQPPIERQPVETFVLEYNDVILAEAMKKELARGGQVYYLHNRVDNIESCAAHVSQMVPGARVGIAHGKMTEEELNPVWQHLLNGEIDILVCTTLIETGIDLNMFTTLIFYNVNYNPFTLRQASRRSWRINQTALRIEVYFFYYIGTVQERALHLMATKLAAAGIIEGHISDEGLAALSECRDVSAQLAKELAQGVQNHVDDMADIFRRMAMLKAPQDTPPPIPQPASPQISPPAATDSSLACAQDAALPVQPQAVPVPIPQTAAYIPMEPCAPAQTGHFEFGVSRLRSASKQSAQELGQISMFELSA